MNAVSQLALYWLLAFVSLGLALVLLNIYCSAIDSDMELLGAKAEILIVTVCSLIEAAGFWLIATYAPMAMARAMFIPALVVAVIYKTAHYQDWSKFEVFLLLMFQIVIGVVTASVCFGQFSSAFWVLIGFGAILGVIGFVSKSMWGE
jgi:hypothetical protein